jgi:hypothetical protein
MEQKRGLAGIMGLLGPRRGILVWRLLDPSCCAAAFSGFLKPLLGFLLAPWTTIACVAVCRGGVRGLNRLWIMLAVLAGPSRYSGWRQPTAAGPLPVTS